MKTCAKDFPARKRAAPKWFLKLAPLPGALYVHKIQTQAGGLQITFYETWIATRFDDPRTAWRLVNADPMDGKWNFFGKDAETKFRKALTAIL